MDIMFCGCVFVARTGHKKLRPISERLGVLWDGIAICERPALAALLTLPHVRECFRINHENSFYKRA